MAGAWTLLKSEVKTFAEAVSGFLGQSDRCQYCQGPLMTYDGKYNYCPNSSCIQQTWDHYIRLNSKSDEIRPCKKPGCTRSAYVENNGQVLNYCSTQHADEHLSFLRGLQDFDEKGPVYFYQKDKKYYELTNFFPCQIMLDGVMWKSAEHYFQAQKFIGTPIVEYIRDSVSARAAFNCSRDSAIEQWKRGDWEQVKKDIMLKALLAKFSQHEPLRRSLLSTGSRELIEASPYDSYWGCGMDGKGKNVLGELLMEIRRLFQEAMKQQSKK